MTYGHFSPDGLEYVITTPETPRPWINYLTNEKYCSVISQCAGGYSFYKDCRTNRLTRWAPENWHFDRPGKYIFVRENAPKGKYWSLTYQPLRVKPQSYECRHGLGYTTITSLNNGILSQVTYFVPENDNCEVWLVKLENKSKKTRDLEIYPYVEFLIGDYHEELRYRNIMNLYSRIWFDKSHEAVFAKKTAQWQGMNIQPFDTLLFFASSLKVKGCCTHKDAFLGRYNSEETPQAILDGDFKNFPLCSGEDGIGTFKHEISLKPGQTKEFTVCLGQTTGIPDITRILSKYRDTKLAKKELAATKELWRKRIVDNIVVETPDKDFNTLFNVWAKYQVYICNFWSRSPSFYHEGSGGRGYRDTAQDSEAVVSINPQLTRQKILKLASLIRRDGTSASGWSETVGPHKFRPNKDHQIWLTVTVAAYIKETGDKDILQEYVSYLKDSWINGWETDPTHKGGAVTDGEGTLFEHLEKNLTFCFNDVGEKGFPRIGHADWNDAIDAAGIKHKGESVWLAQALVRSLKVLAELCELVGEMQKKSEYLQMAKTMDERINGAGWDGEWYARGFDDDGLVYGSKQDKEGKIFLNTQAWAILGGVAKNSRLTKILNSVDKYLNGPHGLALFYPAFSSWVKRLGRISMFSEGTKENAAVFCHAATFMAVAYATVGYGDKAYEACRKIMPNAQKDMDLYKTEPYVFAEYLVGPENPYRYGEGAFTWITGSAGWNFMLATEWILGARRDFEGLRIDPCIPKKWKKCFIRRPFRGDIYEIEIHNPQGLEHGVKQVFVDNEEIQGNLIVPFKDGKIHKVKVLMG
jgi:cellobiose phosphorylase